MTPNGGPKKEVTKVSRKTVISTQISKCVMEQRLIKINNPKPDKKTNVADAHKLAVRSLPATIFVWL